MSTAKARAKTTILKAARKMPAAKSKARVRKEIPLKPKASKASAAKSAVRKPAAKVSAKKIAEPRSSAGDAKTREKKFTELFGPSLPKGKGLNSKGEPLTSAEFEAQGWCVMQFPPKPGRLSWVYATHGLSSAGAKGKDRSARMELVMHWRDKDLAPLELLNAAVAHLLEAGHALAPGQIVSKEDGFPISAELIKHCLAFDPEPISPRTIELPGGAIRTLVLLGISDAELEAATKVRPELADGRLVLMEALRLGGVFPVTDPKRQCLTRRRDFMRIWETAFRTVRERKS